MNLFACLSSHPFPSLSSVSYFCCLSRWLEVTIPLCLGLQLEQFNMIENAISSNSLYSPCSTLNYSQAAMMGLTGSHGSLQDSPQLSYSSHGNIPNIILTGEQTPRFAEPGCAVLPWLGGAGQELGVAALWGSVSACVGAEFLAVGLLLHPCHRRSAPLLAHASTRAELLPLPELAGRDYFSVPYGGESGHSWTFGSSFCIGH